MQKTSALYRKILAGIHTKETRVSIGDTGFLVDKRGNGSAAPEFWLGLPAQMPDTE